MPRSTDTIPAAPFVAWVNDQLARLRADETLIEHASAHAVPAARILADRLGVTERSVRRYMQSLDGDGRPRDTYDRAPIEDMLHRAGTPFWEVYPDLDDDGEPAAPRYCPTCRDDVTPHDDRCPWCDSGDLQDQRPYGSVPRLGQGRKLTDDQVRAAHRIYTEKGLSLRALGELLWQPYGYANAESATSGLRRAFQGLGLPRRHWLEASLAVHVTHGLARRTENGKQRSEYLAYRQAKRRAERGTCTAVRSDGTPCPRTARPGSDRCGYHQPAEIQRRTNQIQAINDQRKQVAA